MEMEYLTRCIKTLAIKPWPYRSSTRSIAAAQRYWIKERMSHSMRELSERSQGRLDVCEAFIDGSFAPGASRLGFLQQHDIGLDVTSQDAEGLPIRRPV